MPALFASWIMILVLALIGIGLIILEAFMPGFGVPGVSGIVLELVALFLTYSNYGLTIALLALLLVLSVIAVILSFTLRSAAKGRLSKSGVILNGRETSAEGYTANEDLSVFIGREGKTLSALRPAGIAEFDGVRLNVVSEGSFINQDVDVRIIRTDGSAVVVRPVS